ncbi:MAG: outer membrane beta-barrel protein [Gemmatimonadaceae bacterium]
MKRTVAIGLSLSLALLASPASPASAQSISFGLRGTGSFPTGSFAENSSTTNTAVIQGAKSGFGYGAEIGLSLGPIGAYGSFDHINFDCETTTCTSDGKYTLQGVTAGLRLSLPVASRFRPFIKGGVTFNDLEGSYGSSSTSNGLTTEKNPGYELGLGADYNLLGLISITPQARYIGQNLKRKVPGVTNTATTPNSGVNYFTFDLGLSLHTPFSN